MRLALRTGLWGLIITLGEGKSNARIMHELLDLRADFRGAEKYNGKV